MKHSYKVLSARKCKKPGCGKYLKQNLIDRIPDAEDCFKHYPHSKKNRPGAHGLGPNRRKLGVSNNANK